jgi:hypothetical protein
MRRSRRVRGDHGAVAVLFAIVLAFALLPAIALATGAYVRTSTGTELQRSSDTGALAGAAEIPLGDVNFAESYASEVTGLGLTTTLQSLGIQNASSIPDPLVDACANAMRDATNSDNLGHSYADTPTCTAKYLPDTSDVADLGNCLNGAAGGVLGGLGINLSALVSSIQGLLPALLEPGVSVTMSWHVTAPLDQVFGGNHGKAQTSTSYARRRFKNIVVLPQVGPINLNPTLQQTRAEVLSLFQPLETALSTPPLSAVAGQCATVLSDVEGDVADAVDPPGGGPSLGSIVGDATDSDEPLLAVVPTTIGGLSIPFLDIVPVCISDVGGNYVATPQTLTGTASCLLNAPGGFRASLRNS